MRCIIRSPPIRIMKIYITFLRNLYHSTQMHIDHFGPLPSVISQRNQTFVVIDGFTKYVKVFAVK